jgi:hypothetical protein
MRYFTWKLDWSSGEGVDPTAVVNSDVVRIEPQLATGALDNPDTLIYAVLFKGDFDITQLTKWSVEETTVDAMFEAAQLINPDVTLVNGLIKFPMSEIELEMFPA